MASGSGIGSSGALGLAGKYGRRIEEFLLRQGDSYSTGTLAAHGVALGTTAPFSLKHWVGYLSIAYVID